MLKSYRCPTPRYIFRSVVFLARAPSMYYFVFFLPRFGSPFAWSSLFGFVSFFFFLVHFRFLFFVYCITGTGLVSVCLVGALVQNILVAGVVKSNYGTYRYHITAPYLFTPMEPDPNKIMLHSFTPLRQWWLIHQGILQSQPRNVLTQSQGRI